MFIKQRKQGGFISAELGIGILVISLLTIMGFLAATDLDDEISRKPSTTSVSDTPISFDTKRAITAFQSGLDSGTYASLYEKYNMIKRSAQAITEELLNQYTRSTDSSFPAEKPSTFATNATWMFDNNFFTHISDSLSTSTKPGDYANKWYELQDWNETGVMKVVMSTPDSINISIRIAAENCEEYFPSLKFAIPGLFEDTECGGSGISVNTTLKKGTNVLSGNTDNSLDGTWMGDL